MNCRLPKKIGTPGGGTSYPDGAFIPVKKFTAGKTYALVAKIDGVYRYINTEKFNDYTLNATEVSVTPGGGYVTFGSEPALFKAEASGDGFTLSNGDNYLYGYSDQYSTALRYDASSSIWTVDTSETGGFASGKYLPKEVASSVWLKNASGDYEWSIKYESAGSFGYDRAGRDSTYSTGFVSFILYEKYEGGSGGNSDKLVIYEAGKAEIQNGTVTIDSYNDYATYSVGSDKLSVTMASNATLRVGRLYIDDIDLTEYTKIVATGYAGANVVAYLGYTINSTDTTSSDFTKGSLTTVSLDISALTGEQQLYVYFEGVKNQAFELYFTEIYLEKGGGSSGGGTTPSEYALTYSTSGSNRLCTIQIGSDAATTFPTTATTKAVAANTNVTVSIGTAYSYSRMYISFNGRTVASGSTGGNLEYTFEMTANTTVKVTQSGSGTSSYPYCVITTE